MDTSNWKRNDRQCEENPDKQLWGLQAGGEQTANMRHPVCWVLFEGFRYLEPLQSHHQGQWGMWTPWPTTMCRGQVWASSPLNQLLYLPPALLLQTPRPWVSFCRWPAFPGWLKEDTGSENLTFHGLTFYKFHIRSPHLSQWTVSSCILAFTACHT